MPRFRKGEVIIKRQVSNEDGDVGILFHFRKYKIDIWASSEKEAIKKLKEVLDGKKKKKK